MSLLMKTGVALLRRESKGFRPAGMKEEDSSSREAGLKPVGKYFGDCIIPNPWLYLGEVTLKPGGGGELKRFSWVGVKIGVFPVGNDGEP
jgi:hypothetical protein